MLKSGSKGIDVGDLISVELVYVDVEQGFIDFKQVGSSGLTIQILKSNP